MLGPTRVDWFETSGYSWTLNDIMHIADVGKRKKKRLHIISIHSGYNQYLIVNKIHHHETLQHTHHGDGFKRGFVEFPRFSIFVIKFYFFKQYVRINDAENDSRGQANDQNVFLMVKCLPVHYSHNVRETVKTVTRTYGTEMSARETVAVLAAAAVVTNDNLNHAPAPQSCNWSLVSYSTSDRNTRST